MTTARRLALALAAGLAFTASAQSLRIGPSLQDAEPTSMWVMFETGVATPGFVDFGLTPALGQSAPSMVTPSNGTAQIHHAQMTGLTPDTIYHYRVRAGSTVSAINTFRTPALAAAEKPFRFAAYSDCQGNSSFPAKHTETVNEGVIDYVTAQYGGNLPDELAFVIVPGDLVDAGSVYEQWKTQFFDEAANLNKLIPYYPALGNHEQNSHWYFDYFHLPENGTPGFTEHWYYKDHGNLRLISLDSNGQYRIPQQLAWLDAVLADAAANPAIDFVFAQFHHPHLSELWTAGNTAYSGDAVARLEQFSEASGKPSAHFFGHTHGYERGSSRDHNHLWVNVAAGEGAVDYWGLVPVADYDEIQKSFPDWGFVIVEVTAGDNPTFNLKRLSRGNEVEFKDNVLMDEVTIRRYNAAPETPSAALPAPASSGADPMGVELRASRFEDPDKSDYHAESHYQLATLDATGNPDWDNAIDLWRRFENWAAPEGASGRDNGYYSVNTVTDPNITHTITPRLLPDTLYTWRVRYRDDGLKWSEYSNPSTFTTGPLPTGACCIPLGGCEQMIEADCLAAGGTFHGVGTACADAPCPQITILFEEDFNDLALGNSIIETPARSNVWTETPPQGWTNDDAGVPTGGVTEWRGWAFADPAWWAEVAGNQGRDGFTKASDTAAIADPDEWDDAPHDPGTYNALLSTPPINIAAAAPGSLKLVLDSSWNPENPQRGEIRVSYDNAPFTAIRVFSSDSTSPDFKPAATNETLVIDLAPPDGATTARFKFALLNAGNNWWWAFDNLRVIAQPGTPTSRIFFEDFEALPLGPNVDEALAATNVWTDTPPAGWSIDESGVPGIGNPAEGITEWEGWAFTNRLWWTQAAGDQRRSEFTLASGTVAVADPDEWDDLGNPEALGPYTTSLTTPDIDLRGLVPGSLRARFASSWRPEGLQRAELRADYSGAPAQVLLDWRSTTGPTFKPDATNEAVALTIPTPPGATAVRLTFTLADARNNWWWAIDNLELIASCVADLAPVHGTLDINDILAFAAAFNLAAAAADLFPAGQGNNAFDINDILAFATAFNAGCP